MSGFVGPQFLAPTGSVGNTTHASVGLTPACSKVAVDFIAEAVGATPTVTFVVQGTLDKPEVSDANAAWTPIALLPAGSETVTAAPAAVTTVSHNLFFLAQSQVRFFRRIRIVTSANTNVTYRAELHQHSIN